MRPPRLPALAPILALLLGAGAACRRPELPSPRAVLAAYAGPGAHPPLEIRYPFDDTLFPPELPAPAFRWNDPAPGAAAWIVGFTFPDGGEPMAFEARVSPWTPTESDWELVKRRSLGRPARAVILGVDRARRIVSAGSIGFSTSPDEVGAPLFYREVNLPFVEAVKDPSRIRWRLGPVSSRAPPPVVLENLPVCGNCHSFSADGRILGMDVDYANDKGSYAIVSVAPRIVLDRGSIITWSDFRREDGEDTFGLLSQVSPDGRWVVSTVKDRSVFVPKPGIEFSQLFFPVKGILALYDRAARSFRPLPGADDPRFVQSHPAWSPDGKTIVFARAEAYPLRAALGKVLLSEEECREFLVQGREFKFDLYRVPFNDGAGGPAEPLEGASRNGASNYFPKYSPDGKWIVFCRAANYSLLQPDSALHIVPAGGGEARRMRCNTPRMNSWHTWSPNGKWLAFASKAFSPYTQILLTHVDEEGRDTPPVLLDRLTAPDRAANIPEFVNAPPDTRISIVERFVDDVSFVRAAQEFLAGNDVPRAIEAYRKALSINPGNAEAHGNLGAVLQETGRPGEARNHLLEALRLDPRNARAHYNLAVALESEGRAEEAEARYQESLRLDPGNPKTHYNLGLLRRRLGDLDGAIRHYQEAVRLDPDDAKSRNNLGLALMHQGRLGEAETHLARAIALDPRHAPAHNNLGTLLMARGRLPEAAGRFEEAIRLDPGHAQAHSNLGAALHRLGRLEEAERHYREALRLDPGLEQARHNLETLLRRNR